MPNFSSDQGRRALRLGRCRLMRLHDGQSGRYRFIHSYLFATHSLLWVSQVRSRWRICRSANRARAVRSETP